MSTPVRVLVTIDTEEDDWWFRSHSEVSVENIRCLTELRAVWERFGVRPTYFVNYLPLASRHSAEVLTEIAQAGDCEMGGHCHPWTTPPLREVDGPGPPVTMMNRISDEENHDKLSRLTDLFMEVFRFRPNSFRAGRWGFGPSVARPLRDLGFTVDASVSPLLDWEPIGGPDYSRSRQVPYRFDPDDPFTPVEEGSMTEVPTSVGFLWGFHRLSGSVRTHLERSPARHLKITGLLDTLGPLARRWLSPETSSIREMTRLSKALVRSGVRVLDLTFHSSTLLPGATPFVRNEADKKRFLGKIETFIEFCSQQGFNFATVSEVADEIRTGVSP